MKPSWIRTFTVLVGLALATGSAAWAKSYRIEEILVDAQVKRDGALQVEERIRYQFKGSYSYAFREFVLKPGESVDNVRVSEEGRAYAESREESPQTYSLSRQGDRVKVTWHFRARNESRAFLLEYRLRGVVRRYADTAELYFQFVGEGWDRPIRQVRAAVGFETPVPPGSLRAWAHGPLFGAVDLPGDGTVRFTVAPLPARTFWEGRVLFPVSLVPVVEQDSAEPALDRILAEERAWAEEANRRREEAVAEQARRHELAEGLLPWSILAAVAGVLIWVFLFMAHGKPHPRERRFPPGEPPGSLQPALVGYLMHRDVGGAAIAATLVDLARRSFLKIEEIEREKSSWFGTKKVQDYRLSRTGKTLADAAGYERDLVEFAFSEAGNGKELWLSEFKKVARRSRSRFLRWFKQWKKQVKEVGRDLFEPWSGKVLAANLASGLGILGFGLYGVIASDSPVGVPAIVAGTLQAIGSVALSRRTPEGQDLYRGYKAFKAHLKSISKGLGPVSFKSKEWGRYLVASIVLGVHRQLSKKLDVARDAEAVNALAWYIPAHGDSGSGLGNFGASISAMVTSVSSTVTSASGAGGGASAGGGGGSGGGGGGAG